MDITGLSVSIDVDMSGFVEAMEEIVALLMTVAQELEALEKNAASSFDSASKSAKDLSDDILDLVEDVALLAADVALIFAGDEIQGGISLFHDIMQSVKDFKKYQDDAKDSTQENTNSIKAQDQAAGNAAQTIQKLSNVIKDTSTGHIPIMTSTGDGHYVNNDSSPGTSGSQSTSSSSLSNDIGDQPTLDEVFADAYKKNLAFVKSLVSSKDAIIKVSASATAVNIHTPDDSSGTANPASSSQQTVAGTQQVTSAVNAQAASYKNLGNNIEGSNKAQKASLDFAPMVEGAIDTLTTSLANIGKKGANPVAGLINTVSNGMKSMGQQMIQIGIGNSLLLSLGTVAPPLLIAGGVALELAANVAMSSIKMADGGLVHGSTFANIGEYAGASHNPEVVAPLDKLRGMMGGGGGTITHRIQGSDLLLVLNKEMSNQGYSSGGNGLQQYQI